MFFIVEFTGKSKNHFSAIKSNFYLDKKISMCTILNTSFAFQSVPLKCTLQSPLVAADILGTSLSVRNSGNL